MTKKLLLVLLVAVVAVVAAPTASAAITFFGTAAFGCQSIGAGGGSHVLNLNQGFGGSAGDTAILVGATEAAFTRGIVTDSTSSNTWTGDASIAPSYGVFLVSTRLATALPSGATVTIPYTSNPAGTSKFSCASLLIFTGLVKGGTYLDQTGSAQSAGSNSFSVSTNGATNQADELVIAGIGATNIGSFMPASNMAGGPAVNGTFAELSTFQIVSTTGQKTLTGSFTPSTPWGSVIATYHSCVTDSSGPSVSAPSAVTVTQTTCQ